MAYKQLCFTNPHKFFFVKNFAVSGSDNSESAMAVSHPNASLAVVLVVGFKSVLVIGCRSFCYCREPAV